MNNENQNTNKPNIHLLAYGGTIASVADKNTDEFYNKPNVDIQTLLKEQIVLKKSRIL